MVSGLFLDLSKAFDTIRHGVLLEKLVLYTPELSWFTDYLFNRSQYAEQNNIRSETHFITSGLTSLHLAFRKGRFWVLFYS